MRALHEQQAAFVRAVYGELLDDRAVRLRENTFDAAQQLQIYRNNQRITLRNALGAVYPVLHKLVGDEFFRPLAAHYLHAHPPASGNIHDVGNAMPEWLAALPETQLLSYLPDVARLEWAYHCVLHAPHDTNFDTAMLAGLNSAQLESLRFTLTPACRLLQSDYPVLAIWNANQPGADGHVDLAAGACRVLVLRRGEGVELHALSNGAYALLEALQRNEPFIRACAAALQADSATDIPALLHYLMERHLIRAATFADEHKESLS